MRRFFKKAVLSALILFVIFWIITILKCEILTYIYGSQFDSIYREHTMIGDIDYLKVLNYTSDTAQVYYVSEEHSSTHIVEFLKVDGKWFYSGWKTVWSRSGSADGFMWPYIR